MTPILLGLATFIALLRPALLVMAGVLFFVFATDWLVRTRRINPFNPIARFFRSSVAPMIAPVEQRVVRAGGNPASAPWWALVVVVLGGIVVLTGLDYVYGMLAAAGSAAQLGPAAIVRLLIAWTFRLLQLALLIRVIASWVRVSEYSRWIRWTVLLTEPIIRPIRALVPPLGMMDLSPLIAWLLLRVLEALVLGLLG